MAHAPICWLDKCRKFNHLIGYISNSNFQIQNRFHAFISLCVFTFVFCRFLLQKVFFKLINIFCSLFSFSLTLSVFPFSGFWQESMKRYSLVSGEITKNFSRKQFRRKKILVHPLELWRNFICGNEMDSLGRAVLLHLTRSGSQSEHRIRHILPARGACNVISIFIIWQTQSLCSDWFFLGQDFAVRTVCMETVQPGVFLFWTEAGEFKIWNQNSEK